MPFLHYREGITTAVQAEAVFAKTLVMPPPPAFVTTNPVMLGFGIFPSTLLASVHHLFFDSFLF